MDFDNSRPIWLQIVDEFSRRIAVGEWGPGERLAGVRELALGLGVNPNTLQRSFAELERDGLVRVERAAGRYVTDDPGAVRALRQRLAGAAADEFIRRACGYGMSLAEAQRLIEGRWTDDNDPDHETAGRNGDHA